ncbi:MAG: hypothetical protein VKJ27_06750 [Synechocystis sp.]|nr:hypothetical protein [Synechocystis sp.]
MWHYRTQYSLSPWAIAVELQVTPSSPTRPQPLPQWQWRYQFSDGSELRGHYYGTLVSGSAPSVHLPTFHIPQVGLTEYVSADRQIPLLQWQPAQFVCYQLGEDLLLLASNDNYVSNSLCLVQSPQRQWAQVTHWGSRLVAEPFAWDHFSIHCRDESPPDSLTVSWQFSPFIAPFFHWKRLSGRSPIMNASI